MEIKDIIKILLDMLHENYSEEDKYHIIMAHNELMKVYEKEER